MTTTTAATYSLTVLEAGFNIMLGKELKQKPMGTVDKSLRSLVEKWFGAIPAMPVRVTRFGSSPSNQRRYVCVEALRPAGLLAIFFFRHDDGAWCVFPPVVKRPEMSASLYAPTRK
jgi:hypothetical protein